MQLTHIASWSQLLYNQWTQLRFTSIWACLNAECCLKFTSVKSKILVLNYLRNQFILKLISLDFIHGNYLDSIICKNSVDIFFEILLNLPRKREIVGEEVNYVVKQIKMPDMLRKIQKYGMSKQLILFSKEFPFFQSLIFFFIYLVVNKTVSSYF